MTFLKGLVGKGCLKRDFCLPIFLGTLEVEKPRCLNRLAKNSLRTCMVRKATEVSKLGVIKAYFDFVNFLS